MNKKKLSRSGSLQSSVTSVLAALLCIVIGMLVGFLVLVAINPAHAWGDGFVRILKGGFHDAPYGVGKELANAAPLIMTGLSVAFAFKTGLFNIGAAGQYTLGAYGALYCAIMLKLPWFVCLLAAAVLGGLWGAIPGFFKAYFNINEVITSIMFNWIGLYLVNELIYQNGTGPMYDVRSGQGSATIVRSMSGGNQQKAIIAREIDKDPKLLVAVQPTRGLDVGAIEYIHRQIVAQRDKGKAVLLVSLELDEVMNLSDRILVMYEGEVVGEFDPKTTTVQELGLYMAGARKQGKESK